MARKIRYLEIKVKGQPLVYTVSRIQYRDKKGRLSKFVKNKLLSVEIIAKRTVVDKKSTRLVLQEKIIKKHGLKLAKRKKPVTVEVTEKRIQRKAKKHSSRMRYFLDGGNMMFASGFFPGPNSKRKKDIRKIELFRGSRNEYREAQKNRLQKNRTISRKIL